MNIVVVGAGMYVTGRGTSGFGTVMPAIAEWKRKGGSISSLKILGTRPRSAESAGEKVREFTSVSGVNLSPELYPREGSVDRFAYRQALDETDEPSCAIVVVPDHLHYQVARDCLDAGFHTLVVKPLTPTVAEARELVETARKMGLYGAVEFHKRWDRSNVMMKDAIRRGDIGSPLYCSVEYSQRKSVPSETFQAWCEETNVLQYLGVHYIDIARFATGAVPVRAMASGQKRWLRGLGLDAFDSVQCMVEWRLPGGENFMQTILANWVDPETSPAMSDQRILFVGTGGRYEADQGYRGIRINRDGSGVEQPNPDFCMPYGDDRVGNTVWRGYGIESICTFLDDVMGITEGRLRPEELEGDRPTFSEGLISTAVVEAVNTSLTEHSDWQDVRGFHGGEHG